MHSRFLSIVCVLTAACAVAEECAAVKWRGMEGYPHIAFPYRLITLKAALVDPEPGAQYVWRWDVRGDGLEIREGAVTRPEAIEAIVAYGRTPERYYPARISVFKRVGAELVLVGEDVYPVLLVPESPQARAAVAIDEGLWYLHTQLVRSIVNGVPSGSYPADPFHIPDFDLVYTATALEAFGRFDDDGPYAATCRALLGGIVNRSVQVFLSVQPQGNPDQNFNGYGLSITGTIGQGAVVPTAFALAALARACDPGDPLPPNGRPGVDGRTVGQAAQDMADFLVFAQNDGALGRGGWRYRANDFASENPVSGWSAVALRAAERRLSTTVPAWSKTEACYWITNTQGADGGFGFSSPANANAMRTAGGIALLALAGSDPTDPTRMARAENYIAAAWCVPVIGPCVSPCIWDDLWRLDNESLVFGNPLCMYTVAQAAGAVIPPIELFAAHPWYDELAAFLTAHQPQLPNEPCASRQATADPDDPSAPHGYWPRTTLNASDACGEVLNTALCLTVLLDGYANPSPLAVLRPQAFMPDVGETTRFDGSASVAFDSSGARVSILRYEFVFGDGSLPYIEDLNSAPDGAFDGATTHVYLAAVPAGVTARLTVTALQDGELRTNESEVVIRPAVSNRAPTAVITFVAGGRPIQGDPACPECTYAVWAGYPFTVSSALSSDPDTGDSIVRREWLDAQGALLGEGQTLALTLPNAGLFPLTLRVTDAGNPMTGEPKPKSGTATLAVLVARDATPPTIELPAPRTLTCAGPQGTLPPADWAPSAVDDLDPAPVVLFDLPTVLMVGETRVLVRARDRDGNESTAEGIFIVKDTEPPVVSAGALVLEAVSKAGAPRPPHWPLAIEDNCDTAFSQSNDAPAMLPLGESVVNVRVSDGSGNSATAVVHVTVVDTTPPVITAERELVLACEGNGAATRPSALPVSAVDAVDGAMPVRNDLPELIPLGVTEAYLEARDAAGNIAAATLRVVVVDTTPPELECPEALTLYATGAQPVMPPAEWRARALDTCEGELEVAAEPAGPYAPGTTTVTWKARDSSGNEAVCEAILEVIGGAAFIRGDANDDGKIEISDAVFLLTYLFAHGKEPACRDAADANDSAAGTSNGIDIADAIFVLNYLFSRGTPPPEPFPACGYDRTGGTHESCRAYTHCTTRN